MTINPTIVYLDCDGTWIDLYGVPNWLDYLMKEDVYPYANAKPLVNLSMMARTIHKLQSNGIKVGIISWLSKCGSAEYNEAVTEAKLAWFRQHLPSVTFDEIHIVKYGTPKSECASTSNAILFDDEERNRKEWLGMAFDETNLLANLRALV